MNTNPTSLANNNYDVSVIGGGPGGAALATFLARAGHRCVVFEQSKFPRYHIGESLIPHTHGIFDRLGLLPQLRGSDFPVKHSVRFVSHGGKESVPFYFSETIPGERARTWQVERSQFDTMMLDHARASGVEVHEQTSIDKALFDGGRAVGVQTVSADATRAEVRSKVVVDASGRACIIGRQLGLRSPLPELRKASAWGYFRGGKRLPGTGLPVVRVRFRIRPLRFAGSSSGSVRRIGAASCVYGAHAARRMSARGESLRVYQLHASRCSGRKVCLANESDLV